MTKYGSYGIQRGFTPRRKKHPLRYFLFTSVALSILAIVWFIAEYKYDAKKQLFTLTDNVALVLTNDQTPSKPVVKKPTPPPVKKPVTKPKPTVINNDKPTVVNNNKPPVKPINNKEVVADDNDNLVNITLANGNEFITKGNGIERKIIFDIENSSQPQIHILDQASFGIDSYDLLAEAELQINNIAKILLNYNNVNILLSGHTDNIGKEEVNQYFSLRRAKSVRNYLVELGVPRNRIRVIGHGETRPIVPNTSRTNRSKNRRIDIIIIK